MSQNKPLIFIRTHIDDDLRIMCREKDFDEKETLKIIRENCLKHLKGSMTCEEDLFLINNNDTNKWDFDRLRHAILNFEPRRRESLLLRLHLLTKEVIKRKINSLRGNYSYTAGSKHAH